MTAELLAKYEHPIREYARQHYTKMFREPDGVLKYKFIVPGSCYSNCLWDWDSWLTDLALRRIAPGRDIVDYEKGCILNFLDHMRPDGRTGISIVPSGDNKLFDDMKNTHKPCLAQHAAFVCEQSEQWEWMRPGFEKLERFIGYYRANCLHESGLYYWLDDGAIGVDNDPCTFYRPACSSASIYLNCLMYKELLAMATLAEKLGLAEKQALYADLAEQLRAAVQENCWDERDGFYYSVDINLLPVDPAQPLHSGCPRHWNCLIQRIGVWSGFMAMWAGIATPEQARRMVAEHYKNEKTFAAPYGVRTLSKMEKMYTVRKTGNPSCWLGPVWGISNYMTFAGLADYGFVAEARELALKSVELFGRDLVQNGEFHEYYDPETGMGVNNPGFQNWNLLVINMMDWLHST